MLFLRSLLRGIGQIFFQNSAWTGLCCLLALTVQSPTLALASLLGLLTATLFGRVYHDDTALKDGLYGFNGALAGLAVMVVLAPTAKSWWLVIIASLLATAIFHFWRRRSPYSPYTAPFIVVTWLLMALSPVLGLPAAVAPNSTETGTVLHAVLRGIGQVIFLDNPLAAALCTLALAVASLRTLSLALLASATGFLLATAVGFPEPLIGLGLYGFNAVLTAEALYAHTQKKRIGLLAGIILSILITRAFQFANLPSLTAPFVLSTWATLIALRHLIPQKTAD